MESNLHKLKVYKSSINKGKMKEINPKKYYNVEQISDRWEVSARTIIRLIQDRKIGSLKIGRQYRILGESILEYETRNASKSKY